MDVASTRVEGSPYVYQPLDLATDAIRLVRILKGVTGQRIECEMLETNLLKVEENPYEALSYVWGNNKLKYKIWFNGCPLEVTGNLFEALLNLRQPGEDRLFWIDAICIDQHHHLERGHQVGQMSHIYKNAHTVVIWLGGSTKEIDRLFHWMNCLDYRMLAIGHRFLGHQPEENPLFTRKSQCEAPCLRRDIFQHVLVKRGLEDLLEREWFSRVWVIQEAALAKTAFITCGRNTVSSEALVLMPGLLDIRCNENVLSRLEVMPGSLRKGSWWYKPEFQDLGMLLQKFGRSQATDPRDIIYSLLGLCKDPFILSGLHPDYNITLQEAIQRTALYLLPQSREGGKDCPNADDMPTWSMDEFLLALGNLQWEVYLWTRLYRKGCLPNIHPYPRRRRFCRHCEFLTGNECPAGNKCRAGGQLLLGGTHS